MKLIGPLNSGAAVGGNGSATANANSTHIISGNVYAVYVKYNDSPPAGTTDITITTLGTTPSPPAQTILAVADSATDAWYYPRALTCVNTTGATIAGAYEEIPIHDFVNVKIAQANAADNIDVWLLVSEL